MKNSALLLGLVVAAATACSACSDSQNVKSGDTGNLASHEIEVKIDDQAKGKVDIVNMDDKILTVKVKGENADVIKISDIIEEVTGIKGDELSKYKCDYQSGDADGFRPTDKEGGKRCPMVDCSLTALSYLGVQSHNLFYADDAPQKNGCYSVTNLARVLMYKSYIIDVKLDGEALASIDIMAMSDKLKDVDGKKVIYISDVIAAAAEVGGKTIQLGDTYCDYADATGWKPASAKSGDCKTIRSCSFADAAYVELADATNKMVTTDGGASCYSVKGIKTVEIFTTDPNAAQGE